MKIVKLSSKEFNDFTAKNPLMTFHQDERWGKLKEYTAWSYEMIGGKVGDKLIAASLLLYKKAPLGIKICYSPRGFIIDYDNKELVKDFVKELKDYLKSKKVSFLKIEPYVLYNRRDSNGEIIEENKSGKDLIALLNDLGFSHHGLGKGIENELQPRWIYRLELNKTYDELFENFSKSTRKNIQACAKKGLTVRKAKTEDLEIVVSILEESSKRKSFIMRSYNYYKQMQDALGDMMTIYLANLDPKTYLEQAKANLKEEQKNSIEIKKKMATSVVGAKLQNQKETSDKLLIKYKEELERAENFAKEYPKGKDIAALISLSAGSEHLSLNSGMLDKYKSFTPKYAMYEAHIKDALKDKKTWSNFYGINGYFTKENNPMYGVYEFKKGFGGEVHELVGEFDLAINPLKFKLYNLVFNLYHKLKKLKARKKS